MKRYQLASLLTLVGIVAACSSNTGNETSTKTDGETPPVATNPKTVSNVFVNERASWTTAKQRDEVVIDDATGSLTFPVANNGALLKKQPGDIIVSDRSKAGNNPYGFMRKVVSVAKVGDTIVMETEQAYLNEIIVGQFDVFADADELEEIVEPGATPSSFGAPGLTTQKSFEYSKGFDLGFEKKDVTFFDKNTTFDVPAGDSNLAVKLGGSLKMSEASFSFKPSVNVGGDIGVPEGLLDMFNPSNYLNEFHVILSGDVAAKLVMQAKANLSVETAKDNAQLENIATKIADKLSKDPKQQFTVDLVNKPFGGVSIPTPLGSLPITFNFGVQLVCSTAINGAAEAEMGYEAKSSASFGTKYTKNGGWQKVQNFNFSVNKIGPEVSLGGGLDVKCTLTPKVESKLAGSAGPSVYVQGSLSAQGQYKENCSAKDEKPDASARVVLKAGLSAGAEAKVSIFSFKLVDKQIDLYNKTWSLVDKEWDLGKNGALGWCMSDSGQGAGGAINSDGDGAGGSSGSDAGGSSGGGAGGSSGGGAGGAGGSVQPECGNGVRKGLEQCDGNDFGNSTCESATGVPNAPGKLKCKSNCTLDTSECFGELTCSHDVCTEGAALPSSCDECTQQVCDANPFCCTVEWDLTCISSAKKHCGQCGE